MDVPKTPLERCSHSKQGENRWSRGRVKGKGDAFGEKWGQQRGVIKEINERDEDEVLRLSGTHVSPPGADPLGGVPDIRHRKPREIVPQVSADASIKTR